MAFIDYYKILGVEKNIPQKDVRKAFLKRTKQFHPDLHPDDPKAKAKFQALNEAYAVISDPDKRSKYDRFGEHWKEAGAFGNAGGAGGAQGFHWKASQGGDPFGGFDFAGNGGFSSFFNDLFGSMGGGKHHCHSCHGDTGEVNSRVDIDLYTALLGGEVVLQLGNGEKVKLKVNPGTQNGTRVRLRGKGEKSGDGTCGDLIITYNVTLPTNLSQRQKELLDQMRSAG